jgi:hypothetical protein
MERKRGKSREISKRPFDGTIRPDNHRIDRFTVNSLGAGLSLDGQLRHLGLLETALPGTPERKSNHSMLRASNSKSYHDKSDREHRVISVIKENREPTEVRSAETTKERGAISPKASNKSI